MTTLMYRNKICLFFLFPFLTENVRVSKVQRVKDDWTAHTGAEVRIFCETSHAFLWSGQKFSWSHFLQPATNTLQVDKPPFSMLSTQWMWSRFLQACQPRNLQNISAKNTCVLFSLGIMWISCFVLFFVLLPGSGLCSCIDRCQNRISKLISSYCESFY